MPPVTVPQPRRGCSAPDPPFVHHHRAVLWTNIKLFGQAQAFFGPHRGGRGLCGDFGALRGDSVGHRVCCGALCETCGDYGGLVGALGHCVSPVGAIRALWALWGAVGPQADTGSAGSDGAGGGLPLLAGGGPAV